MLPKIPWNKGKTGLYSPQHRAKLAAAATRRFKGVPKPETQRRKIGLASLGRSLPLSARRKIADANRRRVCKESTRIKHRLSRLGGKHSEETKRKQSDALRGKYVGEKHPQWKQDRSLIKLSPRRDDVIYRGWRKRVRDRDKWNCRLANKDCFGKVVAHHIFPWRSHPELRYDVSNGITLCHFHHPRKHADETRLSPLFQSLVAEAV